MKSFTLRLDKESEQRLVEMAADNGGNRSQVVRELIKASRAEPSPYAELGTSGLQRFGGTLREEKLPELRGASGRKLYREMRQNDAVISAVFFAVEMALRQVRWFAESASDKPEDKEAAEFLEQSLFDMSFSWDDTLQFILSMLEQGFSLLELVYKRRQGPEPRKHAGAPDPARSQFDDGRVGWRKWAPRPDETLASGNEWIFDEHGGVQGINQQAPPDYVLRKIPIEKLLLFRTTPAPANSPEGWPILRGMYVAYYYASNVAEIEGIGVERDLAGLPVFYLGRGCSLTGTNSDFALAKDIGRNIRRDEQECVVIPHPKLGEAGPGEGMLLELLSAGGSRQFDTDKIISRYNRLKAMTVLAQFLMLGMEKVGSYALSKTQGDFFTLAVDAWAKGIAETVNRYAVPRLFRLNAFRMKELPRLSRSSVGVPDLEGTARYVNALVGSEVLTPDENLERFLREAAQFPPKMEEPSVIKLEKKELRPEEAREEFRKEFQRIYSRWLTKHADSLVRAARLKGQVQKAELWSALSKALVDLAKKLKQTLRKGLNQAMQKGRGDGAASPTALAQLSAKIEEAEGYVGEPPTEREVEVMSPDERKRTGAPLLVAAALLLKSALSDPEVTEASLVAEGETLRARIGSYDGTWWSALHIGWGDQAEKKRVRWVLDPLAKHCEECPTLAGVYENWDALPKVPGETKCNGNCRCRVEIERDGKWEWL